MKEVVIHDNLMKPAMFEAIHMTALHSEYQDISRGNGTEITVALCSKFLTKPIFDKLEEDLGKFTVLDSFLRLNTPDIDTELRIHSDKYAAGNPTHGVIFYINIEEGGTGFWTHKIHGDKLPDGVEQDEIEFGDESLWTFREYIEGKPNRLIYYPSELFHQRHPTVPTKDRYIFVAFIKQETV